MAFDRVIPTEQDLKGISLSNIDTEELIRHAQDSVAVDSHLTILQALKKYRRAVFWAMLLSTSLIMEGYDLVIVCHVSLAECVARTKIVSSRLPRSTDKSNSRAVLARQIQQPVPNLLRLAGSPDYPTPLRLGN